MKHLLRPLAELCVGKAILHWCHPTHAGHMPKIHSGADFSVYAFPLNTAVV